MLKLNQIKDRPGASKKSRPLGRGIGSGRGKTCSRGGKGQTARTGVSIKGFEGGQTPLYRRLPKIGFRSRSRSAGVGLNLDDLQAALDAGMLRAEEPLGIEELLKVNSVKKKNVKLKILGRGTLISKVHICAHAFTAQARNKIEQAKGFCFLVGQEIQE